MGTVKAEIEINATPQVVWDFIMDPERWGDWVTIHRSVTVKSERADVQGAELDQVMRLRGVDFTVHWTLAEVDAPRTAKWSGRGPAMSKAFIGYEISGDPEGPTTFHYANDFAAPGGALGAVASRVVVGNGPQREAQESLRRLKALLERQ